MGKILEKKLLGKITLGKNTVNSYSFVSRN